MQNEQGPWPKYIATKELARRLGLSESWVRKHSDPKRVVDPIPSKKFGMHVRFEWAGERFQEWLKRRDRPAEKGEDSEPKTVTHGRVRSI